MASTIPGSKEVEVDGVKVHYHDTGAADAPPVVLIHGYISSSYTWRNVWPQLAPHNRVIIIDLPGHGKSGWSTSRYTLDAFSDFFARFFERLGLARPAVVGAQMGGSIAAWFAAKNPHLVSKLVVMAAGGLGERSTNLFLYRLVSVPGLGNLIVRSFKRETFARRLRDNYVNKGAATDEVIAKYYENFKRTGQVQTRIGYQVRMCFENNHAEYASVVGQIKTPTLLIWGEDDPLVPLATGLKFKSAIAGSALVAIPNCGDFPQEEYPDLVSSHVLDFITDKKITRRRKSAI